MAGHPPRKAGLGTMPPRPYLQRWAQGSKEGKPSCNLPSQLCLHRGGGGLACGELPPSQGGDPNLSLGFQDLCHRVPQWPTWVWEGTQRGYRHRSGPVLVPFAFYRPNNAQVCS